MSLMMLMIVEGFLNSDISQPDRRIQKHHYLLLHERKGKGR